LVAWVYVIGDPSRQAFRWNLPFRVMETTQRVELGQSIEISSKREAESYENREDLASTAPN
jgi:hypothetical protein